MDITVPPILQHNVSTTDPNLDHISRELYKSILYEPSDDSFLFMEALERDLNTLRILFSSGTQQSESESAGDHIENYITGTTSPLILELGPGTGIISSYAAKLLSAAPVLINSPTTSSADTANNNDIQLTVPTPSIIFPRKSHDTQTFSPRIVALDLNRVAVDMTTQTFKINNPETPTEVYESDLLSHLPPQHLDSVNLLLFNPPYVPSEDYEHENRDPNEMIMNAYAGGNEGRAILNQLVPQLTKLFTPALPLEATSTPAHTTTFDPISPFLFYCVFLWPVNNIVSLNEMMNESLSKATNTPGRFYKSHIILARQCGLESLAIVRYVPDYLYSRFPRELMNLHPRADEANFKAIFQPQLIPFSPEPNSSDILNADNVQSANHIPHQADNIDDESDDDDDDNDSGFSLF